MRRRIYLTIMPLPAFIWLVLFVISIQKLLTEIQNLILWKSKYFIISGTINQLKSQSYFIGSLILVVSIIFPVLKLLTLLLL